MSDAVFTTRDGPVATIHLNRPGKRNALNLDMWRRLSAQVDKADADPKVKLIVITGEGEAFAAGADIAEFERVFRDKKAAREIAKVTAAAQDRIARAKKPVIAKINGSCVGGGCGIALCCDLRFADTTAKFGITPAKLGLVYSLAGTKRLVDAVGPSKAKDMLFTGRILGADEALRMGLIDRLLPPADLNAAVAEFTAGVCAASQFSVRNAKKIIGLIRQGQAKDTAATRRLFVTAFSGVDFKEGHAAFLAKRPPAFKY